MGTTDHVVGGAAPVTLIEYGDFTSFECLQVFHVLQGLRRRYPRALRIVYRHACPRQGHPQGLLAAEAAEAAGAQGQFWAMHDALFARRPELTLAGLGAQARVLDLDVHRFRADLESHRFLSRIRRHDHADATTGAPSFFIDGRLHEGTTDLAGLSAAVERALRAFTTRILDEARGRATR